MSALLLSVVLGIFTHSEEDLNHKICYYDSVYGEYAITIKVWEVCPIEIEIEED